MILNKIGETEREEREKEKTRFNRVCRYVYEKSFYIEFIKILLNAFLNII